MWLTCTVGTAAAIDYKLNERDLKGWRLVKDFEKRLKSAAKHHGLDRSWSHPRRQLKHENYLSLFLFGMINPVVKTMRGLCAASHLGRLQREVCDRPVSLGSFSEAQSLVDPALLERVFEDLGTSLAKASGSGDDKARLWLIQDSSLFEALPRMYWALWRWQGRTQGQVRLHLSLDAQSDSPARARITTGKTCERAAWREQFRPGDAYVADRYYGEDYKLFGQLDQTSIAFVIRLRDEAVVTIEEELPLTQADREARVQRSAWVHLGCKNRYRSMRLRMVWVQTDKEVLKLVTNLAVEELSAADVALLYWKRWQIEVFFRWIKCLLGCRHWLAESPRGAAIQLYLALIAALLLQLYTGQRPSRRTLEWIQFYLIGMASLDELQAGLQRERAATARRKKS